MPPLHPKAASNTDPADLRGSTELGRPTPLRAESALGAAPG